MSLESRLVNLAAVGRTLVETGMVRATYGSVSLRWEDQCYISPANARLDRLSAADFIPLSIDADNTWQLRRASRDHAIHLACLRARSDAQIVLFIHPPNCTALGCAGLSIGVISPRFFLAVGAGVPAVPYLAPSSQELTNAVVEQIVHHNAVLLRNQGLVLVAADSDEALVRSQMIEDAARMVLLAYAATGSCSFLTKEQTEALEQLADRSRRT